ncbi:MAG TPA: DUF2277 domain-containing protein [Candidatus Thermoplasmatota archaeon]|nr:DUF2277 domain-containing protein [Candidatus Thermoplasmatota archaeon]
MCRNIRPLFNFQPAATPVEIREASLQFVRKITGFANPSQANADAFGQAVAEVAAAARKVLRTLVTNAQPRNREREARKARARAAARFGTK